MVLARGRGAASGGPWSEFAGAGRYSDSLLCHVALFDTDWMAMITEIHYWTAH
jgi:hypothetical protein